MTRKHLHVEPLTRFGATVDGTDLLTLVRSTLDAVRVLRSEVVHVHPHTGCDVYTDRADRVVTLLTRSGFTLS